MARRNSKGEEAWCEFLNSDARVLEQIESEGYCDVTASDLRQFREPRLMCKIDHEEKTPKPLRDEKLSVLAITSSEYRIARTNPFIRLDKNHFPKNHPDQEFSLQDHLTTLDVNNITSESMAIDVAAASGMIDAISNDSTTLTIRGRRRTGEFNFSLEDTNRKPIDYPINGVQIEVDGGYEGNDSVTLIEAKIGLSKTMSLRQLLYPELHFLPKLEEKKISTFYFCYEPVGQFHFLPFLYDGATASFDYQGYRYYRISTTSECSRFSDAIRNFQVDFYKTRCDNAPFPQADDFTKILTLTYRLLEAGGAAIDELFIDESLVPRQFNYYIAAARWLGLVEKKRNGFYSPTQFAHHVFGMPEAQRLFTLAQVFYSNPLVHKFIETDTPKISDEIRERENLTSDSTFNRRMQTVLNWKRYFNDRLT